MLHQRNSEMLQIKWLMSFGKLQQKIDFILLFANSFFFVEYPILKAQFNIVIGLKNVELWCVMLIMLIKLMYVYMGAKTY